MHPKQQMNQIVDRLNAAAESNEGISLTAEDVQILAAEVGDLHYIPVLTNEQIVQLCKEGKLGQPIINNKD